MQKNTETITHAFRVTLASENVSRIPGHATVDVLATPSYATYEALFLMAGLAVTGVKKNPVKFGPLGAPQKLHLSYTRGQVRVFFVYSKCTSISIYVCTFRFHFSDFLSFSARKVKMSVSSRYENCGSAERKCHGAAR